MDSCQCTDEDAAELEFMTKEMRRGGGGEATSTSWMTNIITMSPLPTSYRPTLQTITASERASKLSGGQSQKMNPDDLIAFNIEEAQHRVINDEKTRNAESALAAHGRMGGKGKAGKTKPNKSSKPDSSLTCKNCIKPDYCSKGGSKEGQGPRQRRRAKKEEEPDSAVVAVDEDKGELFAFICTSAYAHIADSLQVPQSRLGTYVDSGASRDYCPDRSKFSKLQTD